MRIGVWPLVLCAAGLTLLACGDNHGATTEVARAVVGAEGGRLEGPGLVLELPAGALGAPQTLSAYLSETELPNNQLLSPIFRFEPAGLQFGAPAQVTLEIPEGRTGIVFWSRPDGSGYEPLGVAENGRGTVEVTHFSEGMVDECSTLQACYCGVTDEQGGVACAHNPGEEAIGCTPDTSGLFFGEEGSSNSGFARRDVFVNMCYCGTTVIYGYDTTRTDQDTILCRREWTMVDGRWECHSDNRGDLPASPAENFATRAWPRPDGGNAACGGYWIDYQYVMSVGENKHKSGFLFGCQPFIERVEWQPVDCQLTGCGAQSLDDLLARAREAQMEAAVVGSATTQACAVPSTELPPTELPPTEPPPTEMPPTEMPATEPPP